jgi:hypothetical protein
MKTIFVLIDQPNLDYLLLPVVEEMISRGGFEIIVCVCNWGKQDLFRNKHIPYVTDPKSFATFYQTSGPRLFLTASDLNVTPNYLGKKLVELCRQKGIPSLSVEHAAHSVYEHWTPQYFIFNSDRIALAGEIEFHKYRKMGISPDRLIITGCPKYDEYYRLLNGSAAIQLFARQVKRKRILFAGVNHGFLKTYSREQWTGILTSIFSELMKKYPDHELHIKPHPADPNHQADELYADAIDPLFEPRIQIIDSHGSLPHSILACDYVVSFTPSVMLESLLLRKPVIFFGQHNGAGSALAACKDAGAVFIDTDWPNITETLNKGLANADTLEVKNIRLCDEFIEKFVHKWDGGAACRIVNLIDRMTARSRIHLIQGVMQEEGFSCP